MFRERYNKMKKLDHSKWIVTKFYHYTSRCQDDIAEYDEIWHQKPVGDPYIKEMFDHFLQCADTYLQIHTGCDYSSLGNQNKITIEITNIDTKEKLYITRYDGRYTVGKSVWSEFNNFEVFGIHRK